MRPIPAVLPVLVLALASGCGASSPGSSTPGDASTALDGTSLAPEAGLDAIRSDAPPPDAGTDDDSSCSNLPAATLVPSTSAQVVIQGEPGSPLGIYDPSLVYAKGAAGGVMSYSTVGPNSVHTRIAVTTDQGATFEYAGEPNTVTPVTVSVTGTDPGFCDAGPCSVDGVLWHEVSSHRGRSRRVAAAPFKLFVHSYVSAGGGTALRRDRGYIGMQTATSPASWGAEQKLLGWQSDATLSTSGATQG